MFDRRAGQLAEASSEYHWEGVAFLRALLDPDPKKRMSAEQALVHRFLAGTFPEVAADLVPTFVKVPLPAPEHKGALAL